MAAWSSPASPSRLRPRSAPWSIWNAFVPENGKSLFDLFAGRAVGTDANRRRAEWGGLQGRAHPGGLIVALTLGAGLSCENRKICDGHHGALEHLGVRWR